MKILIRICLAASLFALLAAFPASVQAVDQTEPRRPNIVYFLVDELGYYELSLMGHPWLRTPNIDQLAAEGVRFTQFLAGSSVCAPTRCTVLTGKHTGHCTIRNNGALFTLRSGEETIASVLKRAGYATGGFGKWGNGARGTSGVPEKHGFDMFFGYYDQKHAHDYFPPYLIRNSQEVPLVGNGKTDNAPGGFSFYRIVEESKHFIRANKDRPFFAYLAWTPPHGSFQMPKSDASYRLYEDKPWKDGAKVYASMVNMLDREVGEVRRLLEELQIADNTLIVFSGDNGGLDYFKDKRNPRGLFRPNVDPRTGTQFRGQKGELYEGGLRIPAIVHWPGRVTAGRVSDHLGYFPDLLPTFAELARVEPVKDGDGISLVPELLGEAASGRKQAQHRFLYWEIGNQTAVRMGRWKAYRRGDRDTAWQLYDFSVETSETHDVSALHPEVLAQVKRIVKHAHTPARNGDILDRDLVNKDRPAPPASKKKKPSAKTKKPRS